MDKIPFALALILVTVSLSGCAGDDGPSAYVDEVHVFIDGTFSDETICQQAVVIESGSYYACTFTLNSDAWIGIDLVIASGSPAVDLITMDDLNFNQWEDGDAHYYLENVSDFGTNGGSYSSDGNLEAGDYVVVVSNR